MTTRTFDRIRRDDPRSVLWPFSALLPPHPTRYDAIQDARIAALEAAIHGQPTPPPVPPTPVPPVPPASPVSSWTVPTKIDQGPEGECVGHGVANFVQSSPKSNPVVGTQVLQNPVAEALYEAAQRFDGSPPDEQSGASVTGGLQAAKAAGYISAYHWCQNIGEVTQALALGPVVIGSDWYQGMSQPDGVGVIRPTGAVLGGHCYLAVGYDPARALIRLQNSWGAAWGVDGGQAFISATNLARLLAAGGEAAVPVKP